mgnify:CR=1 FL=1
MTEEDEEGERQADDQSEVYPNMQAGEEHESSQSSEKPEHLLMKLLGVTILSWQATFKICDIAIKSLLLCIKQLMWIMGTVLCTDSLTTFANDMPNTLFSLEGLDRHPL